MRTETSAGGIVIKNPRSNPLVLVIRDMNGNWTFPKGIIEEHENPEDAAQREIREETGLGHLKLLTMLSVISYMYQRNGLVRKSVHYYLFISGSETDTLTPQSDEGISEAIWMPLEEAIGVIGYPKTNKKLLEDVRTKLGRLRS